MGLLEDLSKRHMQLVEKDKCFTDFRAWLLEQLITRYSVIVDKINTLLINHGKPVLKLKQTRLLVSLCAGTPSLAGFVRRYTPAKDPVQAMADLHNVMELLNQKYGKTVSKKIYNKSVEELLAAQSEVALLPSTATIHKHLSRQLMIPGVPEPREKPRIGKREKQVLDIVANNPRIDQWQLFAKLSSVHGTKKWTERQAYKTSQKLVAKSAIRLEPDENGVPYMVAL